VGGNIFTAQLSNVSGSFASPTVIGSLNSSGSGTIAAAISLATPIGNGYRIRVVGSYPPVIGTDNGSNLTINTISVTIADVYAVSPGSQANTIYIGYGPASLTLTSNPSAGVAPYSYSWSTGSTNQSITINPSVVGTYNYAVTVTDSRGCQKTISKTVTVADVRCGKKLDRVIICNNGNQKCASANSVNNQLQNGATLGFCPVIPVAIIANPNVFTQIDLGIYIIPNPNTGQFKVQLNNYSPGKVTMQIIDGKGTVVMQKNVKLIGKEQTVEFEMQNHPSGIYYVRVIGERSIQTVKMVISR